MFHITQPFETSTVIHHGVHHARRALLRGSSEDSFSWEGGGIGAVQGATFTVPAHGSISLTYTIHATAISQDDMNKFESLVKSMMDASHYAQYKSHAEASASGHWSLFGGASASASASMTRDSMSGYGISPENQTKLIETLNTMFAQPSTYTATVTVNNTNYDYSVSGQIMVYSFTGHITTSQGTKQTRMIGGPVAQGSGGESLPVTAPFS